MKTLLKVVGQMAKSDDDDVVFTLARLNSIGPPFYGMAKLKRAKEDRVCPNKQ